MVADGIGRPTPLVLRRGVGAVNVSIVTIRAIRTGWPGHDFPSSGTQASPPVGTGVPSPAVGWPAAMPWTKQLRGASAGEDTGTEASKRPQPGGSSRTGLHHLPQRRRWADDFTTPADGRRIPRASLNHRVRSSPAQRPPLPTSRSTTRDPPETDDRNSRGESRLKPHLGKSPSEASPLNATGQPRLTGRDRVRHDEYCNRTRTAAAGRAACATVRGMHPVRLRHHPPDGL